MNMGVGTMSDNKEKHDQRVLLVSKDNQFIQSIKTAFATLDKIELEVFQESINEAVSRIRNSEAHIVMIDCNANQSEELEALKFALRPNGPTRRPAIIITEEFSASAVRMMVQMHIQDFLVKPVSTSDIVRSCMNALKGEDADTENEARVSTFMPAAGGVGVTTLALEAAYILHHASVAGGSTCIVDLNFQHGCCAEYLDLEPRFNLDEVENNPDRLDRQLLEVMISRHSSGLAVISAPFQPSDMRSFDERIVTRLLDLVSAYFDNVVIDMPRTWFPWTESVMMGSDDFYLVAEMTVPCLRHAQRMLQAIDEKLGKQIKPKVIVNRFDASGKTGGITEDDIRAVLKDAFYGTVPNNYRVIREALDKGAPLQEVQAECPVTQALKRILLPNDYQVIKKGLLSSLFKRKAG
jgi:pilus assembly protein CpaE